MNLRTLPLLVITALILMAVGFSFSNLAHDAPLLTDSTLGELAVWMSDQAQSETRPSLLGSWAQSWGGNLDALLTLMQRGFLAWCIAAAGLIGIGGIGLIRSADWTRSMLLFGLIGLDALLLIIPVSNDNTLLRLVILGIVVMLGAMLFAPGRITKVIGFMVMISAVLVVWEVSKSLAASINYAVTIPQAGYTYTTYPTLDDALKALEAGEITAVFEDRNQLDQLMPGYPQASADDGTTYPNLRYLSRLQTPGGLFPQTPAIPGRISIALRADDAARYTQAESFIGLPIGAVEGGFAADRYLSLPRQMVLLDLKILNDLNLPHLQSIAEAFMQPARRNGDFLLARILADAGLYTWREAVFGFGFGVIFGLLLGTAFAHSRLMERALLPYVVASQTIPILAIAPMVVIWLGASFTSVAVIAAYITFFPVTINTLRGLQSPQPMAVDLMQSYAANWWTILWKLRFPAALPYIFTALKVSATASVVGAIIGELPSGISDGLGRAILNFSSDYSLVSTPKLWAAIFTAAFVGITFFIAVSLVERVVLRRYIRSDDGS